MSEYDLPTNFGQLVEDKYSNALANGDVIFQESTSEYLEENDVQYVLTYAPGLAKKPTQEKAPEQDSRPEGFNPFANPEESMTVIKDYANGQFNILLNKYPIVNNHLLLTTKEFKSQNSPLSPQDLIASLKIIEALEKSNKKNEKFFGFYNCGDNSGASQPHKHLQFLKIPDNFSPLPSGLVSNQDPFIATSRREPLQSKNVPFAHYVLPLEKDSTKLYDEDYLALAFSSLLQRTLTTLRDSEKPTAYNVVFTKKFLMVIPRSEAYYKGKLGLNATAFIGSILAKNEELLNMIKEVGPGKILEAVGFPNTADQTTDEYHY